MPVFRHSSAAVTAEARSSPGMKLRTARRTNRRRGNRSLSHGFRAIHRKTVRTATSGSLRRPKRSATAGTIAPGDQVLSEIPRVSLRCNVAPELRQFVRNQRRTR